MAITLPWADPNKCKECCGGLRVIQVSSARYTCGFETKAVTCNVCAGSGLRPPTVADVKLAAAGGER